MAMLRRTLGVCLAIFSLGVIGFAFIGCGPSSTGTNTSGGTAPPKNQVKRLNAGGATFIQPMMEKWAAEYETAKGTQINYTGKGSGAGISEMTSKVIDFGCTDAPMNDKQLEEAKAAGGEVVHIPLAMGAVVAAYNLKEAGDKTLVFSGPVLADIYLGKIKKWNDPKIKELNPGVDLPDKDIAVSYRADGSGTNYTFVEYLSKVSDEWKSGPGVGTSVKFPTGTGVQKSDGIAAFVQKNEGSIGYVELIYALNNKIKYASMKNKEGNVVNGDVASVTAAAAAMLTNIPDDLRYSLTDAPGKDSYPISGTDWAILYVNQPANKKQAIVDFLTWATHDGQQYTEALHYAKLPAGLVEKIDKKLATVQAK